MHKTIEANHVFETLKKSILADGMDFVLDLEKSKGSRLVDGRTGRAKIDFFSFFASNPIGFNHPRMSEPAFEKQLLKYSKVKVSNSDIYTTGFTEFVESFHENCTPNFDKLFFIEGGALGVENALKVAQDWKVRKNMAAGRGEIGTEVLHFKQAFHGRTGYTMSLTNTLPEKVAYFPKFDWPRVSNPSLSFPATDAVIESTAAAEKKALEEIEKAFSEREHRICAILIEPIQGEGGDNFFRKEFLQALKKVSDEKDCLLIFDEVQTGMGITGKMWAHEHYGVTPDVMSFGKKVQVCGCAARLEKLEGVDHVFKVSSRINSTFGGNLTDMIRTTQFIDIITEEKLVDNAATLGKQMLGELESLAKEDERISNARGLGLWMAFDLPDTETRNKVVSKAWENDVIVLPCGDKSVRLRPVLDLKQDEADEGLSKIKKSVKEI